MALRLREVVTAGLWMILLAAFAFTLFGCKAYMQDDAKFEVGFKTMLTFEQIGPKEADRQSEAGIDFQDWAKKPIVEYFIDSDGDGVNDQSGEIEDEAAVDPGAVDPE